MNDVLYRQYVLPSGKKKYVPCEVITNSLPTGIYFVDIRKNCKETASCSYLTNLYKLGEPKVIDLTEVCGMHQLTRKIMENDEFIQLTSKPCSLEEVVTKTISIINSFKK